MKSICLGLLLFITGTDLTAATNSNEKSETGSMAEKNKEINELQQKVTQFINDNVMNAAIIKELRNQIDIQNKIIDELPNKLLAAIGEKAIDVEANKELDFKLVSLMMQIDNYEEQLKNHKETIEQLQQQIPQNQINFINCDVKSSSCIPYENSPGIENIKVPTFTPFAVLVCDTQMNGPGWTVIQQRINGIEDFYRDWEAYRNGFGSFNGDFFLGLEKIHQLTIFQRHVLYIHMEEFNGTINYVQYDNFKVAPESDNYRLLSVGEHSGSIESRMKYNVHQQFSTFDRDNDGNDNGNCAIDRHGGWWYKDCSYCNLNGKYFSSRKFDKKALHWIKFYSLKTVRMLIRPKIG